MIRINVSHQPYRITLFHNDEIVHNTWNLEEIVQKAYELGLNDAAKEHIEKAEEDKLENLANTPE